MLDPNIISEHTLDDYILLDVKLTQIEHTNKIEYYAKYSQVLLKTNTKVPNEGMIKPIS